MSLSSEIQSRISANELVSLTNPGTDNTDALTLNTTRLNNAISDVEQYFSIYANLTFNENDEKHIAVGIQCTIMILKLYKDLSTSASEKIYDRIKTLLEDLAASTSRARIMPRSNSQLTISDENPTGDEINPDFDRGRLGGVIGTADNFSTLNDGA